MSQNPPLAFVIMPFDEEFDSVYEHIIKPGIEGAGYRVERADEAIHQRNIVGHVVRSIKAAALVVADVTGPNANVMWELGVAHSLGKPVILLTQNVAKLPFDLSSYMVRQYSTRLPDFMDDVTFLRETASKAMTAPQEFSNPVVDFLDDVSIAVAPPVDEEQMPGLLDLLAESENATDRMTTAMEQLGEAASENARRLEQRTREMTQWQDSGAPGGATKARQLAVAAAGDMFEYADRIAELTGELDDSWHTVESSLLPYIERIPLSEVEDAAETLSQLQELRETMDETIDPVTELRRSLHENQEALQGMRGVSKDLDAAVARVALRTSNIIRFCDRYEHGTSRAVSALRARENELSSQLIELPPAVVDGGSALSPEDA